MVSTNTYQAQANELSQKLWAIANELRGQMDASEFKNYILGVIFYRYLSERTEMYMAEILKNDGVTYEEAFKDDEYRPVVEEWSLSKLGYVIKPENLFRNLIRKITKFDNDADKFSVEDFEKAINDLVGSTIHQLDLVDFVRHLHPLDWTKQRLSVIAPADLHLCCWKFRSI